MDPESKYSDDFLVRVLKKASLSRILRTSEQGLLQPITEGGQNFSAGERQLLCICRAILRKSRLVIMDEATAFIDMITEQKVQELISQEFKESTMIMIAHRLNTVQTCDKIMVLESGKLVEFDSPVKLKK